jgi:hypothetical protein
MKLKENEDREKWWALLRGRYFSLLSALPPVVTAPTKGFPPTSDRLKSCQYQSSVTHLTLRKTQVRGGKGAAL